LKQLSEKPLHVGEIVQSLALGLLRRLVASGHARIFGKHSETETADVNQGVDVVRCETMACFNISKLSKRRYS
jgi:hypothetical protein